MAKETLERCGVGGEFLAVLGSAAGTTVSVLSTLVA